MTYTFNENIISDLHKDAFGFRPSEAWWRAWNSQNDDGKQTVWNYLCRIIEENIAAEKEHEARALRDFETQVANTIALGAGDRATALRWMTSSENFYNEQCVEHWVWNQGILFTDEGRQLVKDLMDIVTFQEYA